MFFWKSLPSSNYIAIYIGFLTDNLLIYYPGGKSLIKIYEKIFLVFFILVQIEEWSGFDLQSFFFIKIYIFRLNFKQK